MNLNQLSPGRLTGLYVAIAGTFLIMAALVWAMYLFTRPESVAQGRVAERKKNLTELSGATAEALNNYGWIDPAKGIARLRIERAMELTVQEYANPAVAKSNLIVQLEKALFQPPPPPAPPNPYE